MSKSQRKQRPGETPRNEECDHRRLLLAADYLLAAEAQPEGGDYLVTAYKDPSKGSGEQEFTFEELVCGMSFLLRMGLVAKRRRPAV